MITRRFAILTGVLLALVVWAHAASFPDSKGVVSDYAGRLSPAEISDLTSLIKQYERHTSIEFAVVVVADLQGMTARQYAIGLGDFWGVGKSARNNGVVLLWAPNERAYALQTGGGLTPDVSDSDLEHITQRDLVPNFRRGQFYAGLRETLQATMDRLGDQTWDERMLSRARRAQQERERRQKESEQDKVAALVGVGILLFLAVAVVVALLIYRSRERGAKLAELAPMSAEIENTLRQAESNVPAIQRLLDGLSKEAPEQDITAMRADFAGQPQRISQIRSDAMLPDLTDVDSYDEVVRIRTRSESECDLLEGVRLRVADIRRAKEKSRVLMEKLSGQSFAPIEPLDSSRRDEIKGLLAKSREDYEQARRDSSMSTFDWLLIYQMLNQSNNGVRQAVQSSQEPYSPPSSWLDSSSSSTSAFGSSGTFGGGGGFSDGGGSSGSY